MSKRLKVGLFLDVFFPMVDGVVVVLDNYAKQLKKLGVDVVVFTPKPRNKNYIDDFPYDVVRCKAFKAFMLDYDLPMPSFDSKFKKILKNSNLDIVHIHSPFTIGKIGVKYAKKHNIPAVATFHSQYYKDFMKQTHSKLLSNLLLKIIMKTFNKCDVGWAVNKEIEKLYKESYGFKKEIMVQNNGTDLKYIDDPQKENALKEKYDIKKDEKILLYVGRIDKIKNLFFTIDALYKLKKDNFKYKMFLIGTGADEKEIKDKINKLKLNDKVILTGKITDRNELTLFYKIADLFIFPSLYDSSSLVQIEAASQKTPTLFIKGAITAATITENVNGYLSNNNLDDFVNKIKEIFSNKKQYDVICENAKNDLVLTWETAVAKAKKDYEKIIKDYKKEKFDKKNKGN